MKLTAIVLVLALVLSGCALFKPGGADVPCEYAKTICEAATVLCSVLNNPASTPTEIQSALDEYNRQSALVNAQAKTLKLMRANP